MKNIVFVLCGVFSSLLVTSLSDSSFGTIKQRHDIIKSIIGNLDDEIVAAGLISDKRLHEIGYALGICNKIPGDTRY